MIKRLAIVVVLVTLAGVAGVMRGWSAQQTSGEARDEARQTFQLAAGARVEVKGINGTVEVETAEITTAEVRVVRTANSREDLEHSRVIVEQTSDGLLVRGEQDDRSVWQRIRGHRRVRQQVRLRVPRRIELIARGINGRVTAGEIDGSVQLSGINGRAEVAQAVGYSEISGVNGRVAVTVRQVGERGIRVSGINGGVELRFSEDLNADVTARGINGSVRADLPGVNMQSEEHSRSSYSARIGNGGAPISISGVNGSVKLTRS